MSEQNAAVALDDATLEFADKVFDLARSGEAQGLATLLAQGLPADLRNHKGDSLLMLASYHGHREAVRVLLEHGADPDLRNNNGQTPLAGAAFKGDLAMVELLLAHGADVEGPTPDGKTVLMMAAMFNRGEIIDSLLEHGARIDATCRRCHRPVRRPADGRGASGGAPVRPALIPDGAPWERIHPRLDCLRACRIPSPVGRVKPALSWAPPCRVAPTCNGTVP